MKIFTFPAGGKKFASTIEDISARKEAERSLARSEERFRNLFSNMTEGFALHEIQTDEEGKPVDYVFVDINPSFERLTGLSREKVIGKRVTEALPGIEPFWIETYGRVALTGEPVSFERHYPAPLDRWFNIIAYRPAEKQFAVIFMDITERKRLESELGKRTLELQSLFNHTNAGLVLFDAARPYMVLAHNQYYQELFSEPYRSRGMVGKNIFEYAPAVEAQGVAAVFDEVVRTGKPVNLLDFPYDSNPPQKSWFNWHLSPVLQDGRVVALASMSINVTDRHEAEEELRRSRAELARALEVGQIGSWRLDLRRNDLIWSNETYRLFGVPQGTPLTYDAFLAIVHPEDRQHINDRWNASLHGEPYDVEHRIVVDGEIKWVREKAYIECNPAGEAEAAFGIAQDITERKKGEALNRALVEQEKIRLGAAVEQASDAVVMVDMSGAIGYVNAAFEAMNHLPREEARTRSYFDLVAGDPSAAAIRKSVVKGQPWHGRLMRETRGGRRVELEVTLSPAKDPSGMVIGGLITEKDVTQESALQRQLLQSQKMESLGTLAGGITHDFNNILAAVLVNTELALLDLETLHPARRSLPLVLQAANRGKDLVKQIITFSRQKEWERKPVEIAPVVKDAMLFLRSILPKNIIVHESVAADSGAILGDPSQIQQILVNLCQNAALAMAESGGDLEVKVEPANVDFNMVVRHPDLKMGCYVRLSVCDTGCGIPRENMDRIFEPFFTTRGPGRGSGLGLAVVHGIVKGFGGAINVYSEPGKGSVFTVYLPRIEGTAKAADSVRMPRPVKGRERILLVEDEASQRESLARGLGRLGYRVTARAGGRSALAAFRKNPAAFDLVITDQTMPRMTGLELAAAIIKLRADTPVILCTGFSENVDGPRIRENGIREFVMKPFTLREITDLIGKALKPPKNGSPGGLS